MLKEYTLKVVVQVGGESDEECEERLQMLFDATPVNFDAYEITHEEIVQVNDEVEHE